MKYIILLAAVCFWAANANKYRQQPDSSEEAIKKVFEKIFGDVESNDPKYNDLKAVLQRLGTLNFEDKAAVAQAGEESIKAGCTLVKAAGYKYSYEARKKRAAEDITEQQLAEALGLQVASLLLKDIYTVYSALEAKDPAVAAKYKDVVYELKNVSASTSEADVTAWLQKYVNAKCGGAVKLGIILLECICNLMINPNVANPIEPEIAKVYKENRKLYNNNAREWTKIFNSKLKTDESRGSALNTKENKDMYSAATTSDLIGTREGKEEAEITTTQELDKLPDGLFLKILKFVCPTELHENASLVCWSWRRVIMKNRADLGMDRTYATNDDYNVDESTIRLTLHNFSKIEESSSFVSKAKFIGCVPWKLRVANEHQTCPTPACWIGLFLMCCPEVSLKVGWSCTAQAKLRLLSKREGEADEQVPTYKIYENGCEMHGFKYFKQTADLAKHDGNRFIKNDAATFEISVTVSGNKITTTRPRLNLRLERSMHELYDHANFLMHSGRVNEAFATNERAIKVCKESEFTETLREQKATFINTKSILEGTGQVRGDHLNYLFDARIIEELNKLRDDPPLLYSAGPIGDDLYSWQATIMGPPDSPYDDETFELRIDLHNYPCTPPIVTFITHIYHPNISPQGTIQLPMLMPSQWTMDKTVSNVLESICSLISNPNIDDAVEPEIAQVYKNNRKLFNHNARIWTKIFGSQMECERKKILQARQTIKSTVAQ